MHKAAVRKKVTEAQFTLQVLNLARVCGWRTAHFRPAMTAHGWRTPVQGDGVGFPDLVLTHRNRGLLIFAELKVGRGVLSDEQVEWRHDLVAARADFRVWRPDDWPEIEALLMGDLKP